MFDTSKFTHTYIKSKIPEIFELALNSSDLETLRHNLLNHAFMMQYEKFDSNDSFSIDSIIRIRDCGHTFQRLLTRSSEDKAGFSLVKAIQDIAQDRPRSDLTPAFYAELLYLLLGLQGRGPGRSLYDSLVLPTKFTGQEAARFRSRQLNELSGEMQIRKQKITSGLAEESITRRKKQRNKILAFFQATEENWEDWRWQVKHIIRNAEMMEQIIPLSNEEKEAIVLARQNTLPFGITPYYLSLFDDEFLSPRDRSIHAQVIPPMSYIEKIKNGARKDGQLDFMRETDTSPEHLITRRYPGICILKPFNTCPQICVYCQRNWEIADAMEPDAMASPEQIETAIKWIEQHPSIQEVLITGGDPLAMTDLEIETILERIARIPAIERIRIGSRVLVTMPMRITENLVNILTQYRLPGRRQVVVVTHIQHPYEITPDTINAVERLRSRGISIYNQLVYTFFVSRRFEAAYLRQLLSRIGIDPYYTFCTKGKEETLAYRVPIARILQEQKEEARLLPGLSRTDEAVYNVPGLGKNYLRAWQHRDLIAILPHGARLYEFHSWEKKISSAVTTYLSEDVPILEYLQRLEAIGEDISDYETIWYYF